MAKTQQASFCLWSMLPTNSHPHLPYTPAALPTLPSSSSTSCCWHSTEFDPPQLWHSSCPRLSSQDSFFLLVRTPLSCGRTPIDMPDAALAFRVLSVATPFDLLKRGRRVGTQPQMTPRFTSMAVHVHIRKPSQVTSYVSSTTCITQYVRMQPAMMTMMPHEKMIKRTNRWLKGRRRWYSVGKGST